MTIETAPDGIFTIEAFKRLPLEGRRWELLDGVVAKMEPYYWDANIATSNVMFRILDHVKKHDLGVTLGPGCGFQLWPGRETVRVTDASFTSWERIPDRKLSSDFPRNAPDLIAEVLSTEEHLGNTLGRIAMFLQAGTRLCWLVDPETRAVTVFHPNRGPVQFHESDTIGGEEVLPGFQAPIPELFEE